MDAVSTEAELTVKIDHALKYNNPDELDELLASINAHLAIRRLQKPEGEFNYGN